MSSMSSPGPTIYYVAKWGDDDSLTPTNPATPMLTIGAAMASASVDSNIVEIIDEGTYDEENIAIEADNVILRHTASHLGRPKLYTSDAAAGWYAFTVGGSDGLGRHDGFTIIGLEIYDYYDAALNGGLIFTYTSPRVNGLHLSGCFIHNVTRLSAENLGGSSAEPNRIEQSVMYFDHRSNDEKIQVNSTGHLEISNCLITSSGGSGGERSIINGNQSPNVTASFSTFIHRGTHGPGNPLRPVIENVSKVINCIVSASQVVGANGGMSYGIQATEHSYNIVRTVSHNWITPGTTNSASQGTGELPNTDALFIDDTVIGTGVSVAENYSIQSTSPARDAGITFDSIAVDITGTVRPQNGSFDIGAFEFVVAPVPDPPFDPITPVAGFRYEADLTSRKILKASGDYAYKYGQDNKQAPFSLTIPGVPTLRNRKTAYSGSR